MLQLLYIKVSPYGLKPFERTIGQTTETMPPSPKTITTDAMTTKRNYKPMRAATYTLLQHLQGFKDNRAWGLLGRTVATPLPQL